MPAKHQIKWQTAAALWKLALQERARPARFDQPALLRFSTDTFMEEVAAILQTDPTRLADHIARPESWSQPDAGWPPLDDAEQTKPLKLYQATHGRFYLVAASLVCRVPGLPDRRVDNAKQERVSFVLRRLVEKGPATFSPRDPTTFQEWGWVAGPQGGDWVAISDPTKVTDSQKGVEERLPMFSMNFVQDRQPRRLFLGLIPVGSRQAHKPDAKISPTTIAPAELANDFFADPRMVEFDAKVSQGLESLRAAVSASPASLTEEQVQNVFLFLLLDFASFLEANSPEVLSEQGSKVEGELSKHLDKAVFFGTQSWRRALQLALSLRETILSGAGGSFPTDHMKLAEIKAALEGVSPQSDKTKLELLVKGALTNDSPGGGAPVAVAQIAPDVVPKIDPSGETFYVIRCVYDQPQCLLFHPAIVSEPSLPFQLAPFFDPDAPARPLRVALPVDTSVAGLRKFPRNVAFLISKELRCQMSRMQGLKLSDLDSGNLGEEKCGQVGMICSLSIPIITLCAMILLMVFVLVLNIVFWWLPFFRVCLPLNLKAKS